MRWTTTDRGRTGYIELTRDESNDYKQRSFCRPTNIIILLVAILGIVGICLGVTKPWEKNDGSNSQTNKFEFIQCKSDSELEYPCCNNFITWMSDK